MDKTIFLIPEPLASAYAVSRDILTKAAAVTEHSEQDDAKGRDEATLTSNCLSFDRGRVRPRSP
ncbi:hypothetical protein [Streptomyces hygroscopicus]|uniref:hypothetical protein n=1 Tax=Streptomyces hygroscopicus TaxID=1912 RepID=UPI001FCB1F77|nr:hypothetical protein [Streptomyces hygroscopicus]